MRRTALVPARSRSWAAPCPSVRRLDQHQHSKAHCPRQLPCGPATRLVSGQLSPGARRRGRERRPEFPAAFRPPAFASWAACSCQGILLSSRSAYRAAPGPWRGFHVPHIPACIPSPGAVYYEASSRVHLRSPARPSPSPAGPWMEQGLLGPTARASHPGRQDLPRTPERGRASSARPELYARHNRTSLPRAHSQCATSCRTTGVDMTKFPPAATYLPGPGAPRWITSPASAPAGPGTRKATSTWAPSPARPPSRPARPPPAKAPATASWPAAAARPKPRSRSATPS
jgi:hypothetical protein